MSKQGITKRQLAMSILKARREEARLAMSSTPDENKARFKELDSQVKKIEDHPLLKKKGKINDIKER